MKCEAEIQNLINSKGRPLSEINPGSDEVALETFVAIEVIELLESCQLPVFGGDILSIDDSGKLIYVYQLWGTQYHSLNWYCNKDDDESYIEYCNRSYVVAKQAIKEAIEASIKFGGKCYIVLVI